MKKVLYVVLGIIVVAGLAAFIFYYNTSLTVKAKPVDAKITVDKKPLSSGEKANIKPGVHEVKIEKEDYITYNKLINLNIGANKLVDIGLRVKPVPEKVLSNKAQFTTLSNNKNSIYYLSEKTMYAIEDINAEKLKFDAISPDFFSDITNIIWAPDQELAIIKQNEKTSLYNFERYDLLHQEITPFDDNGIKNTVWSPDSKNILYYYEPGSGERTFIKATPTNTQKEIIYNFLDTQIKNPTIDISPDKKDVLLVANNKLYILNLYTNQMKVISGEEVVVEAQFSPDNNIIMVTQSGVYMINREGQSKTKLNFYTNLERITFINKNQLILSEKIDTRYKFYLYNLAENDKIELVYNQKTNVNPIDNIITSDEKILYFESNNYLYRMTVDTGKY